MVIHYKDMLRLKEIPFKEACMFVTEHHRHHRSPIGHKFSLGAFINDELIGVAIVGRPIARGLDKAGNFEVTRLCTTGQKNACSFLYAASAREVKRRGGKWIFTYILKEESGVSLIAAGWFRTILTRPTGRKWRFEKYLNK